MKQRRCLVMALILALLCGCMIPQASAEAGNKSQKKLTFTTVKGESYPPEEWDYKEFDVEGDVFQIEADKAGKIKVKVTSKSGKALGAVYVGLRRKMKDNFPYSSNEDMSMLKESSMTVELKIRKGKSYLEIFPFSNTGTYEYKAVVTAEDKSLKKIKTIQSGISYGD